MDVERSAEGAARMRQVVRENRGSLRSLIQSADEAASGQRRAGVFTGVWTAAETLGLAVGPGLLGGLLALAGYVSSTGGEVVAQSGTAVLAVRLGFSVVPAVLVLASLPVLARYRLDDREAAA